VPTTSNDQAQAELTRRLLARAPAIKNACDLDVMVFLHRHPRALLTSEQLAAFVGYNLKEVAKALDVFIEAGLLTRTAQQSMHAARMFVLLLDGPQGGGVRALLELAPTREGRQSIVEAQEGRGTDPDLPGASPELRLVERA
jgi:hypothetical protein